MRSVLWRIELPWGLPPIPIHGYGLMILVGFFLAVWVAAREARRRGLPDFVYDLGLVMLLAGLLGGRITYYIRNYQSNYAEKPLLEFFKIWEGGLVFYGGAIFGAVAGWIYLRKKRLPLAECLDVAALGVPLAMGIGRVGCFLHGCCWGRRCDPEFPLKALTCFPIGSPVHAEELKAGLLASPFSPALPVHPVQLYQAAHDILVFGLLYFYLRRPEAPRGGGMPLLFILYGVGRFFLEGLRDDEAPTFTGLTFSQNLSLVLLGVFTPLFLKAWLKEEESVAPALGPGGEGFVKRGAAGEKREAF